MSPETSLLELAGIRHKRGVVDWKRERDHLSRSLYPVRRGHRVRLKEARQNWGTWFVIRVMCAFEPKYLDHPIMKEVRNHRWFSGANLAKIRRIIGSPIGDSLEAARRILGHSNWTEMMDSYCISWPVIFALVSMP